jgi:hypothetical protein
MTRKEQIMGMMDDMKDKMGDKMSDMPQEMQERMQMLKSKEQAGTMTDSERSEYSRLKGQSGMSGQ